MQRELITLGVNHHSAPVEIREQLAIKDAALDAALAQLVQLPSIEEGLILSTCNRVEVTAATGDGDRAIDDLMSFLASAERVSFEILVPHLSVFRGRDAIRHIFRVAASLDSMVVGEPQILGQMKESYEKAASSGTAGIVLHRCFHKSFNVAKRVRSETGVGSKAVSVSSAAVELTSKIFERLEDKTAMLIGAGDMAELAAHHLLGRGVKSLIVANRTFDRAVELAREFQGTPVPFNELERYLPMADIIIGSTAADSFILTTAMVQSVLRQRKYRSMFLIDMSVPRNFDPKINDLDNVYLYDIDDLSSVAQYNRDEREKEAEKAEAIIEEEVDSFCRWMSTLDAVPTIVALRERAEEIRRLELAKTLGSLRDLGGRERDALEAMTEAIVNKLLHAPIQHIKEGGRREGLRYLAMTRELFDIDDKADEE